MHNPDTVLRAAQYKILTRILNFVTIPEYIYAFEKNKSIPVMANKHINKAVVLSIDLKDFFHSIKQKRLVETFTTLGIGAAPALTLSELCTYKAFVPQGALTSPKIANIITALSFGPEVKTYCDSNNLTVTIYADDITVSSDDPTLNVSQVLGELIGVMRRHKFRVNHEKTKVMRSTQRQYVCGVVVNKKSNLIKRERYKLRAIVHNIVCNGIEIESNKTGVTPDQFLNHIKGRVNWMQQLNPELGLKLHNKLYEYLSRIKEEDQAALALSCSNTLAETGSDQPLEQQLESAENSTTPW